MVNILSKKMSDSQFTSPSATIGRIGGEPVLAEREGMFDNQLELKKKVAGVVSIS